MDRHMDIAGSIFVVWLTTHANSPTRFNFTSRQIIAKKNHFYTLLMMFYPMRGSANVDCQYHDRLDFISPSRLFRTARLL